MQRYIYGNINKAGFQTVSSEKTFFAKYYGQMKPLMTYDTSSKHGDLPLGDHRCFWLLSTDFMVPGGKTYLFLQESSMDVFRSAAVVQGYREDPEEGDLYGPKFLTYLKAPFPSPKEAMEMAEAVGVGKELEPVSRQALGDLPVEPKALPGNLLQIVLLELMRRKRVILRLDTAGKTAMEQSRAYLMSIYQRLPYELRRNNGCLTGATPTMLGELSQAFTLVLVDGDTDLGDYESDFRTRVLDMTADRNLPAPEGTFSGLLRFLTESTQEEVDSFFAACRTYLEGDSQASYPSLEKYCSLLGLYGIDKKQITGEDIRAWAVSLHDDNWTEALHRVILEKIARAMPAESLIAYLQQENPNYEALKTFGNLTDADTMPEENIPRDQNSALTLRLMLSLPGYDRQRVCQALANHFIQQAKAGHPCLAEENPTRKTVEELNALWLPTPEGEGWLAQLKQLVRTSLEESIQTVTQHHSQNLAAQKEAGDALVAAWMLPALETLYGQLQANSLWEELIVGWNEAIAVRIHRTCLGAPKPDTLDSYDSQIRETEAMLDQMQTHGGALSDHQKEEVDGCLKKWRGILKLCRRSCADARELEGWLGELEKADMDRKLIRRLQTEKARAMLLTIPEGLPLEEVLARLDCAVAHKALLEDTNVFFQPWKIRSEAQTLRDQICALRSYKKQNGKQPKLTNDRICRWIGENLPENKDLMVLLISQKPFQREDMLPILAKRGRNVTAQDLKDLYLAGCSKDSILSAGQRGASPSWQEAMETFLPELPSLPVPLEPSPVEESNLAKVLQWIQLGLVAVAGLLPGVMMLVLGGNGPLGWIVTLVCLAVPAAVTGVLGALTKGGPRKGFYLGLTLALIPGFLVAMVGLILAIVA